MELCEARIASNDKLRKDWNKRLENNSMAVDRLQENRELWLRAGGPEPEDLASPTALHVEDVAKALGTLHAMLEKHGPAGGLDSFIEDIKAPARICPLYMRHLLCERACFVAIAGVCVEAATRLLKIVSWESIKNATRDVPVVWPSCFDHCAF